MTVGDVRLLQTWQDVPKLSKLQHGEAVTSLACSNTNKQNLEAARNAAIDLCGVVTKSNYRRARASFPSAETRRFHWQDGASG